VNRFLQDKGIKQTLKECRRNNRERISLAGSQITLHFRSISSTALFRRYRFTLQDKITIHSTDILSTACGEGGGDGECELITWISPFNGRNQLHDISMAYGNEVSAGCIYCSPCLVFRIAAASDVCSQRAGLNFLFINRTFDSVALQLYSQ